MTLDKLDEKVEHNIATHGWHCMHVGGDEAWPAFTYSIGWGFERGWPEVIVVGPGLELAHGMLLGFWESDLPPAPGQKREDILRGYPCRVAAVHPTWHDFLFGRALAAYERRGLTFRGLQCVFPNRDGLFPDDLDCPQQFRASQPLVSKPMEREPGTWH